MSEFDTGYSVVIGKPVVHADKKATGSSVSFPCEAIPDGSYLVSLEVNGSVKAYRESLEFSSGSCTVGAYTLSYSSYALTVSGTSNNDIVRVMVEPLEVKTTDAFRAAVKKDAPETPNELPAVAAVDEGKVLTVSTVTEKGAVIAAEQTVTFNSKTSIGHINNVDTSLMTDGATLLVTIDDTEYVVTYTEEPFECGIFTISPENETTLSIYASDPTATAVVSINLASNSGVWGAQEPIGKKFIVTLTPTSPDYSGTMDKTVAEINAAYEAGLEIWFKVLTSASTSVEIPLTYWATNNFTEYHGFEVSLVDASTNMMIVAYVGSTNDGTKQTYDTKIYTLTPAT